MKRALAHTGFALGLLLSLVCRGQCFNELVGLSCCCAETRSVHERVGCNCCAAQTRTSGGTLCGTVCTCTSLPEAVLLAAVGDRSRDACAACSELAAENPPVDSAGADASPVLPARIDDIRPPGSLPLYLAQRVLRI